MPKGLSDAGVRWPLGVIGILLVSFGVCGVTVYFAVSDSSYAVERDYYEQAVGWDESVKARAASEALGWDARVSIELDEAGRAVIRVGLVDRDGEPVEGAAVECSAFHYARRGESFDGVLPNAGEGVYAATVDGAAAGQWQVRVRARLGDAVYLTRLDVTTNGGAR